VTRGGSSALLVNSFCGCGARTVRKPRNGNVRRWKLVPEDGEGQQTEKPKWVL
jgi:hypothetical protein